MHLLNRLYDLDEGQDGCHGSGRITIGGVDIAKIKRSYLRKNVGIVLQEPFLFSRTIQENIGITCEEKDRDAMLEYVRSVARSACYLVRWTEAACCDCKNADTERASYDL